MTSNKWKWAVIALLTLIVVFVMAPKASSHPDGLERVAEDYGFMEMADKGFERAPFPDYLVQTPILANGSLQVGFAGLLGIVIVAGVLWGIGKMLVSKRDLYD